VRSFHPPHPESRLWEAFQLEQSAPLGLKPRYNIAPSHSVQIIRNTHAGREMVLARWGLVPHWSKEPKPKHSTINARIETVAEKPICRTPFKHRCRLIPADDSHEWKVVDGQKVPHHIRMKDGGGVCPSRPLGSAGRHAGGMSCSYCFRSVPADESPRVSGKSLNPIAEQFPILGT
jgi:hypothetical protein